MREDLAEQSDWEELGVLWSPSGSGSDVSRGRAVLEAIVRFTTSAEQKRTAWRGHCSIGYRLCPSAARRPLKRSLNQPQVTRAVDRQLRRAGNAARFWRSGGDFDRLSPLLKLAHLQHHGVRSPLIDITPDPMIALWMACQTPSDSEVPEDGLLLGLSDYQKKQGGRKRWQWQTISPRTKRGYEASIKRLRAASQVGRLDPTVINDRVVVQRSRFLISWVTHERGNWFRPISDIWLPPLPLGWDKDKLAGVMKNTKGKPAHIPLVGFRIPAALKPTLLGVLERSYGIQRETVFPDIEALSDQERPSA